ncbi:hypothetical protein FGIG_12187 [Fasciola gigantica]|uniref:Uncharacterized protein n=1 Tax=Fasciola gigantica TaxID=46835 RepID=A0A504YFA7_FASGI|nr:hypothetical protein FGIG_12187 [Fasciola gigantica]
MWAGIRILLLLFGVLLAADQAFGCTQSKSKKSLTKNECDSLINEVIYECYKSALKKKDCGIPSIKTTPSFAEACRTCTECVPKAQKCIHKDLKKGKLSNCPDAERMAISLNHIKKNY